MRSTELPQYVDALWARAAERPALSTAWRTAAVVADTVAVAQLAAKQPELAAFAQPPAAGPASTVVADLSHTTPDTAAMVNATAAVWNELDEGLRGAGHPAAHVVPAAVAVAEATGRTVPELLTAVVCGYQVQADLGRTFVLDERVHPHGALGAPAAAVAAASLLGLDRERTTQAINIAADLAPAGSWASCVGGRTARHVLAGAGAAVGVRAAYLARAGVTGAPDALDLAFGHVRGEVKAPGAPSGGNEAGWAIHGGYLKRWSACAWSHAVLDATASLLGSLGRQAPVVPRVRRVLVTVPSVSMRLQDIHRDSALAVRFSIPVLVATLLTYGELNRHVDTACDDTEVLDLATRVQVTEDTAMTRRWPAQMAAVVCVELTDGTSLDARVDDAAGHESDEDYVDAVRHKLRRLDARRRLLDDLLDQTGDSSAVVRDLFTNETSTRDQRSQRGNM